MNESNPIRKQLTDEGHAACLKILAALDAAGPVRMPITEAEFNDDDVYVYIAATNQLVTSWPSAAYEVRDSGRIGFRVLAGQSWAKGMAAKHLGLWRKS